MATCSPSQQINEMSEGTHMRLPGGVVTKAASKRAKPSLHVVPWNGPAHFTGNRGRPHYNHGR